MNVFHYVVTRSVIIYVIFLLIAMLAVDRLVNYRRTILVEERVSQIVDPAIAEVLRQTRAEAVADLRIINYSSYGVLVIFFAIITFLLMRNIVRPAQKVLASQERFLANAAHELRTPLTTLRTATELAQQYTSNPTPEQFKKFLKSVSDDAINMTSILNNLLLISYAQGTLEPKLNTVVVDMREVLQKVVKDTESMSDAAGVSVESSLKADCRVRGDPIACEQIMANLVRNAVHHTPRGGKVAVSLLQTNTSTTIHIADSGVGIRADELQDIMEPFFKGSLKVNKHDGGAGLGLSIVKELVRLQRGSIDITSIEGKGTTVVVTFPRLTPVRA